MAYGGDFGMTTRKISRMGAKWTTPRYKRDWRNICALLPAYLEDGTNGALVTYLDGSDEAVAYRLQWVLDDLLGYLRTSRQVLTSQSKAYLGRQARRVPLIVSPELSLVPVKGREAIGEYDSINGYVVMEHVEDVISCSGANRIYFTGGSFVAVQDALETLWGNLNLTKELKQKLEEELQWQSIPLQSPVA